MLLGMKAELGAEQEEIFLRSGTLHLFAISGLHIGAMAVALHGAMLLMRVPRRASAVVQLLLLWTYVQATGAPPSAVRAWIMIAFLRAAQELRWPGNAISAIAASALVVLFIDPFQLFGASFQMSYAVVASLLLIGIPLSDRVDNWFKPFSMLPEPEWTWLHRKCANGMRKTVQTVMICFAATLVSMPMAVDVFGWFTPGSFFANLLVVPLAILVVSAGFCASCFGMVGIPWVPELFNHAGALVIATMEWFLANVVEVPGIAHPAEFRTEWLGGALIVALLAILLTGYMGRWRGVIRVWVPLAFVVVGMAITIRLASA
jgi:competence protein ComEC